MTNLDFENLELLDGERVWLEDIGGFGSWGKYREDYNAIAKTFLFTADRGAGFTLTVSLPSLRKIERQGQPVSGSGVVRCASGADGARL
jgi:hypothetical protein